MQLPAREPLISDFTPSPNWPKLLTLVYADELGGGQGRGHPRASHVRLVTVQLLIHFLDRDRRRNMVRVDANAHLAWYALASRVWRLRNASFGLK